MPRRATDLHRMVRQILQHHSPLLPEADCPIQHFERSANVGMSLIKYIGDHIDPADIYGAVYDRHLGHLRRMALAELIESFERFIKELASVCIDFLAPYTADDRFDEFTLKRGEQIAAFVNAGSVGKALCESDTWLRNDTINKRFRSLLKDHFGPDWEALFPEPNQSPALERDRAATLAILWQVRHNLAHNVGVITQSDSMKLRVLIDGPVAAGCRLSPSRDDLRYVKRFLSETATHSNQRVGVRLALLLERLHAADPTLFDAQAKADEVSLRFQAVFLTLARKAPSIRKPEHLAGWLHGVARRIAGKARARLLRRRQREQPLVDVAVTREDDVLWRELRPLLDEELAGLPAQYRAAFVLCHLQGKTHAEAAKAKDKVMPKSPR